jgi:hypothetical protein
MRLRHLVAADNVDEEGTIVDPTLVRHGILVGGRVDALAGPIDPMTHLNSEFDHDLEECVVVATLEVGAAASSSEAGFTLAAADHRAYRRLGPVDRGARLVEWRMAIAALRARA